MSDGPYKATHSYDPKADKPIWTVLNTETGCVLHADFYDEGNAELQAWLLNQDRKEMAA